LSRQDLSSLFGFDILHYCQACFNFPSLRSESNILFLARQSARKGKAAFSARRKPAGFLAWQKKLERYQD
jgi:hypothetical protein